MLHRPTVALALIGVFGGGALTGCDSGSSAADETVALAPPPVASTVARVEIPAGFPNEIPLPADIEIEGANELVGDSTIFEVTGWHPGEPVPLGEAYLAELRQRGFEITSRSDSTTSVLFIVEGPEWFVSAGFYPDAIRQTGTSIGLTVGPASVAP